jgi:hypothetical protein
MYTITGYHKGGSAAYTVVTAKDALNARIEALLMGGKDSVHLTTIQGPQGELVAYSEFQAPLVYVCRRFRNEADIKMELANSRPSPNLLRLRMV